MNQRTKLPQNFRMLKMLALAAVLVLTACDKEDPQQYVNDGKALLEKGDLESARVQFKNALQINPKLAEAYYGLALLDEKSSDFRSLIKNIQEVLALDPNHVGAHVKSGFLQIGDLAKAKEQAAIALKLQPDNLDAILLDARIKFAEKNTGEALARIDQVLTQEPFHPDALLLQATTFLSESRYEDALATASRGLKKLPDNMALGRLIIKVHIAQQKVDDVITDYQYLLEKHPDDQRLRNEFVLVLTQVGRFEQAEQVLQAAISKHPDDVQLKLSLVDLVEPRDGTRAESLLKEYIGSNSTDVKLKGRLAGFYLGHQRQDEAKKWMQEIAAADAKGKEGLLTKVRLAEMAWGENDRIAAANLVQDVLNVDVSNSEALQLRARMRLAENNTEEAISDLRIVLRDQPNSDQAMTLMAQAYAMKGEPEVAESHWRKALELNPANLGALVPLTNQYLGRGDAAKAEELAAKSLKSVPGNPSLTELLVKIKAARKDWQGAEALAGQLKAAPQSATLGLMLSGMLADSQQKHQEAIKSYKEVLTQTPNAVEPLLAMGRSYEAAGKRGDYVAFLKNFIKENPRNIAAYNALALAFSADKNWEQAKAVLTQALEVEPKSVSSYTLLAELLWQQGKTSEIVELYKKALKVLPESFDLQLQLAKYYEATQDYPAAIAAYDRLWSKFPNNDEIVNNLAYLLVEFSADSDRFTKALKLVERFRNARNPYFLDTYAWVLFKSGDATQSLAVLKDVVTKLPDNPDCHYHLGMVHFQRGDLPASKAALEQALALYGPKQNSTKIQPVRDLLSRIDKAADS